MPEKFYITTAIDYVNAAPHIGHALEKVQADVLARYHRLLEEDVFFVTGTDEHGAKIARAAQEQGKELREFVDENARHFKELTRALDISHDVFIRTTNREAHWPAVEKVWRALDRAGDLYKKEYEGLYCVGHEAFVTKKDLIEGKCSLHGKEPEVVREENYFFRLSKYGEEIKKRIKSGELRIVPKERENEIARLIEGGLEDVSFSRPSKDLKWGIPVPGDSSQTIYVWADALTNYLSAIGYGSDEAEQKEKFELYWPADVHVIGKDILRFHAAIWPGMLLSLGMPLPKAILVHGFITVAGQKMSKSLGNVIDPFEAVRRYGADAVRYYLLREIPPTKDGDFTYEKFEHRYSSDLAKGLGNLAARVIGLGERHIAESFMPAFTKKTKEEVDAHWSAYNEALENYRFDEALKSVWELVSYGDRTIDSTKLWELPENDPPRFYETLTELATLLLYISWMVRPFMPETSDKLFAQLGIDPTKPEHQPIRLRRGEALFPRIMV